MKNAAPVVRTLERSHHGPILLREGRKAFAVACPYLDQIDFVTEGYRVMTARNLAEFDAAMAMNQLMEQNVMYADVVGNIRVDQAWGLFQVSGALHEVNGSYNILNTAAANAILIDAPSTRAWLENSAAEAVTVNGAVVTASVPLAYVIV